MKIVIKPDVMARLLSYALATTNEYSGFGFCDRGEDGDIHIYDFVLLNVGSWGYTQIEPRDMLPLLQREDRRKMKVWIHKHPVGTGIPGPHNWSSRDEQTIQREPLGATPEAVNWSVSVVLTPGGFVGRIDNYLKGITNHLEVEPSTKSFFEQVWDLEAKSELPHSSKKRKKKSSGLPGDRNYHFEFPAPETQNGIPTGQEIRKTVRIAGRRSSIKKKTSSEIIPGETMDTVLSTEISHRITMPPGITIPRILSDQPAMLEYIPRLSSCAPNSTPPQPPSPTSAAPTEWIGPGSTGGSSDPDPTNPDCELHNSGGIHNSD